MLCALLVEGGEEIVLLSQVIAHSCNIGYETQSNLRLSKFNGVPVRSLKHLKRLIDIAAATGLDAVESNKGSGLATEIVTLAERTALQESQRERTSKNSGGAFVFEFANGMLIVLDAAAALQAQVQVCL